MMSVSTVLTMITASAAVMGDLSLLYTSAFLAISLVSSTYGQNDAVSGKSFVFTTKHFLM